MTRRLIIVAASVFCFAAFAPGEALAEERNWGQQFVDGLKKWERDLNAVKPKREKPEKPKREKPKRENSSQSDLSGCVFPPLTGFDARSSLGGGDDVGI